LTKISRSDIASGHEGMRYIWPSRELIASSIETVVQAHRLEIKDNELQDRLSSWQRPPRKITNGYLGIYSKLAASAAEGAILKTD